MKRTRRTALSVIVAVASLGPAARAHHSISAVYDEKQPVTIEGVVTEFQFINPHPIVVVDVKSQGGAQEWRLEMDTHRELSDLGFTVDTFQQGDRIVVTGSKARRQAQSLYIRKLDRPSDGFSYEQVGTTPFIRSPGRVSPAGQR